MSNDIFFKKNFGWCEGANKIVEYKNFVTACEIFLGL